MRGWAKFTTLLLAGGALLTGCASSNDDAPRVYERQVDMRELAAAVRVDNEYLMCQTEATAGRFSCALAVAKYESGDKAGNAQLTTMTPMDEAAWVETMRGLVEVTNLHFLSPINVVPGKADVEKLCRAARAQGAALLMLYLPNRYGPNSAQVLGVLYDTASCQALAALHASSQFLDEEGLETPLDELEGDFRDRDACYQAMRDYQRKTVECLSALIDEDAPSPSTQPHRWETPVNERWWLP